MMPVSAPKLSPFNQLLVTLKELGYGEAAHNLKQHHQGDYAAMLRQWRRYVANRPMRGVEFGRSDVGKVYEAETLGDV